MISLLTINYLWIAIAIITFVALTFFDIKAPYGRHATDRWGKMISNKWGWFIMEFPALVIMPLLVFTGSAEKDYSSILLVTLWLVHYFNRTLIFPFKIKTNNKKMPILIVVSAFFFNSVNGTLNGYYLGYVKEPTTVLLSLIHI